MCVQMQANTQINKRSQCIGLIIIAMAERFWSTFMLMIRIRKYSASYRNLIFNSVAFQDYSRVFTMQNNIYFAMIQNSMSQRGSYFMYILTLLIY